MNFKGKDVHGALILKKKYVSRKDLTETKTVSAQILVRKLELVML
jgi:hypothetical protein